MLTKITSIENNGYTVVAQTNKNQNSNGQIDVFFPNRELAYTDYNRCFLSVDALYTYLKGISTGR